MSSQGKDDSFALMKFMVLNALQMQTSAPYQEWILRLQALAEMTEVPSWLRLQPQTSNVTGEGPQGRPQPQSSTTNPSPYLEVGFMVSDQGEIQSCVWFRTFEEICEIDYIFTLPQARGQGWAKELLFNLCQRALKESLFKEVWLEVEERNTAAIRLYESLGFINEHKRKDYYGQGRHGFNYRLKLL
ncbi:MAG: GNAT family N-acetyltransferase [Bdellovibrionaceae bacterium]|nr:GNAT family N-acetyltransferase [Pseudobdellovibrionaceae bacterium]